MLLVTPWERFNSYKHSACHGSAGGSRNDARMERKPNERGGKVGVGT